LPFFTVMAGYWLSSSIGRLLSKSLGTGAVWALEGWKVNTDASSG
jgi:hypothetical protein